MSILPLSLHLSRFIAEMMRISEPRCYRLATAVERDGSVVPIGEANLYFSSKQHPCAP